MIRLRLANFVHLSFPPARSWILILLERRVCLFLRSVRGDFAAVDDTVLRRTEVCLQRFEFEKVLVNDRQILWLEPHHLVPIVQVELHWHLELNLATGAFAAVEEELLVLLLMRNGHNGAIVVEELGLRRLTIGCSKLLIDLVNDATFRRTLSQLLLDLGLPLQILVHGVSQLFLRLPKQMRILLQIKVGRIVRLLVGGLQVLLLKLA